MGKVKTLLDAEVQSEDGVIDSDIDARRESKMAAREIRETGRRHSRINRRLAAAERRQMDEERATRRAEEADDYGDAIRLGYVWAGIAIVVAALAFLSHFGVL